MPSKYLCLIKYKDIPTLAVGSSSVVIYVWVLGFPTMFFCFCVRLLTTLRMRVKFSLSTIKSNIIDVIINVNVNSVFGLLILL
jgi:hypothetical protein